MYHEQMRESQNVRMGGQLLWAKLSLANPSRVSGYGRSAASCTELLFRILSDLCDRIASCVWPDSEPTWRGDHNESGDWADRWHRNLSKIAAFVFSVDPNSGLARVPA